MMYQASYLLPMLLTMLAGRGLSPQTLDPWRAWVVFKQYARAVDEEPDPGVSVQLTSLPDERGVTLTFIRQVVERVDNNWLEPVGGVVVDFYYEDWNSEVEEAEFWSFDFGSFERFVDIVEQAPGIADRMTRAPVRSSIYWEDA